MEFLFNWFFLGHYIFGYCFDSVVLNLIDIQRQIIIDLINNLALNLVINGYSRGVKTNNIMALCLFYYPIHHFVLVVSCYRKNGK